MFDFTEKYEKIKNLVKLCKYDKALQIIQELEDNLELTKKNQFLIKLEQSKILNIKANYQEAIENSLEYYQKCQIEGFSLISLDLVIECAARYYREGTSKT